MNLNRVKLGRAVTFMKDFASVVFNISTNISTSGADN